MTDELNEEHLGFVEVDGTRTRYYEDGEGEPLVLVHGGHFGSEYQLGAWSRNLPGLAERFHVYAFDKLGQGFTDNPDRDPDYTFDAAIEHARGFVEAMGIERPHVVGHSRGGLLVAALALDRPELTRSVTVADSNSLAPVPDAEGHAFYEALDERTPDGPPSLDSVRVEPEANAYDTTHVTDELLERNLEAARLAKSQRARDRMDELYASVFEPSVDRVKEDTLTRIEEEGMPVPTQIVWGFDDPSARFEWGVDLYEILCAATDEAQFHVLNRAGHYAFREHPAAFNTFVAAFCLD